jgi:hypothetical protein
MRKKSIGESWNKRLTKETDERLRKAGEKESLTKIKT